MNISEPTRQFITEHSEENTQMLALQAAKYPEVDMPVAITQISGKQKAKEKIPSWYYKDDILYPRHLSLEQCSSEATATYKASLVQGESLTDLTGGFGVDCAFLSKHFKRVNYVEQSKELCEIAKTNFSALNLNHIQIFNEDGVNYLQKMDKVSCIFIDPARRNENGGKTVAISDCTPDVKTLSSILLDKGQLVMIKLSPMLDLSLALQDLTDTYEVHILSVGNECKELLLFLKKERISEPVIHCVNLLKGKETQKFTFTRQQEQMTNCEYTSSLEQYVYEPNASILKAGAYKCIAEAYQLKKLHPNSHLYTSDSLIETFPGRIFHNESVFSLNKKELKQNLEDIRQGNITVRNFPISTNELRKRMKLNDGGNNYFFATTLSDDRKIIVRCKKI